MRWTNGRRVKNPTKLMSEITPVSRVDDREMRETFTYWRPPKSPRCAAATHAMHRGGAKFKGRWSRCQQRAQKWNLCRRHWSGARWRTRLCAIMNGLDDG